MSLLKPGERWTVIEGDCLDVLPTIGAVDAVVTDPPYGMNWDVDSSRFTGGEQGPAPRGHARWKPVAGDDKPFDPSPWLGFEKVILWGANHYAARLPIGTTLVWVKRNDAAFGSFLSDAETGWQRGGHGVYCFRVLREFFATDHPTTETHRVDALVPNTARARA